MKRQLGLVLLVMSLFIQVPAADAAGTWPGYPKQWEEGIYEIIPGVVFHSPEATLKYRTDVFPPDLELTKDLKVKAAVVEKVYSNNEQAQAVYDVFEHIAGKIGVETVENFTQGTQIYSLPDFSFANMRAEKVGMSEIWGIYLYFQKEIWIDMGVPVPTWKNTLVHELGHCYDEYRYEQDGFFASDNIYDEYMHGEAAPLTYFGALSWLENPSDWFTEAFVIYSGYPDLDRYPPLDLYETYQPGVKAEILRGAECIEKMTRSEQKR